MDYFKFEIFVSVTLKLILTKFRAKNVLESAPSKVKKHSTTRLLNFS